MQLTSETQLHHVTEGLKFNANAAGECTLTLSWGIFMLDDAQAYQGSGKKNTGFQWG